MSLSRAGLALQLHRKHHHSKRPEKRCMGGRVQGMGNVVCSLEKHVVIEPVSVSYPLQCLI